MKKLAAIALGAIALSGCAYAKRIPVSPPTTTVPAVVTIVEGTTETIDVSPPQRLDVRYPGSDGIEETYWQERCDDSGGVLVWSTTFAPDGEFVCQGVDY